MAQEDMTPTGERQERTKAKYSHESDDHEDSVKTGSGDVNVINDIGGNIGDNVAEDITTGEVEGNADEQSLGNRNPEQKTNEGVDDTKNAVNNANPSLPITSKEVSKDEAEIEKGVGNPKTGTNGAH